MQLIKLRALCLATLLVSSFTSQVFAGDYSNIYTGAGLGYSNYSSIEDLYLEPGSNENQYYDIDENAIAFQFFAGWEFVPHYLALEFSYINFGESETEYQYSETSGSNVAEYRDSYQFQTTATGVALKGMLPLGKSLTVFGKAGYASWDVEGKARIETYFNGIKDSSYKLKDNDLDGENFFYSVGAEYHYSNNLAIYGEYLVQEAEHDADGKTYNFFEAAMLSAGITWRFDKPRRRSSSSGKGSESESDTSGKRNITACDEKYKDVMGIICDD